MFIDAAGLATHVQLDGPVDGPPIVLLHSLGTAAAVWEAQAEALSGSLRVIRPDLRGHGLTELTPGPYTIGGLAADVLAALDALGVRAFHLAGLSIGGLVAQAIAAAVPGRVRRLVLCDTALVIPPAPLWHERAALVRAKGMEALADAVLSRWLTPARQSGLGARALRTMLLRTPPEGYAASAEAIAAADFTASSAGLDVPTLILVGDGDQATPPSAAEALRDTIQGASLSIIADAAHIPTVEQPEAVTQALRTFLQDTPA